MTSNTPEIGAHCSLSSCNVNDFLPIRCRCDHLFCREHISPDLHSCPVIQTSGVDINELTLASDSSSSSLQKCAASGCSKPSLEAFVSDSLRSDTKGRAAALCPRCQQAFCATHRDISAHGCTAEDPKETAKSESSKKNATARQLLAKHFPQTGSNKSTPVVSAASGSGSSSRSMPTNPKKAAQLRQVQAMKLRHKAQPGDPRDKGKPVGLGEKLHVLVRLEEGNAEPKVFWFRKTAGTGRTLDLLASHFGLSGSQPTYLHKKVHDDTELLQNDKNLEEQVQDGDELVIKR